MSWSSNGYNYTTEHLPGKKEYKVFIECYTYNQKEYVRDMFEGIVRQETDFPYFAVVIDDASDDGTQEIIKEYCERYPDKIGALLAQENIFGKKESYGIWQDFLVQFSDGAEYIATCEGDDYWTDTHKLQIQTDYMDSHPECMMYLHNAWWLDCRTGEKRRADTFECSDGRRLDMSELIAIKKGHSATASRMYRRQILDAPDFIYECSVGDYPASLYSASVGYVYYSDKPMCLYRFMSKGSTSVLQEDSLAYRFYHRFGVIRFLLQFDVMTRFLYHADISDKIREFMLSLLSVLDGESAVDFWQTYNEKYYITETEEWIELLDHYIRQLSDDGYICEELTDMISEYDKIVIMGTGKYAALLTKQLTDNGFSISGYARSQIRDEEHTYNGLPVWRLDEIPYMQGEFLLLVGILPKIDDGIYESLLTAHILNYVNPYNMADLYRCRYRAKEGNLTGTSVDACKTNDIGAGNIG